MKFYIHDVKGIIEESRSPWMAPAIFIPKKSGDIRMQEQQVDILTSKNHMLQNIIP